MRSKLESELALHIRAAGLPEPKREMRFHPPRMWRFDFAWSTHNLAVECEGGHWTGGRHVRGAGFEKDIQKYNQAQIDGWRVLRFTASMIKSGEALRTIERAIKGEEYYS